VFQNTVNDFSLHLHRMNAPDSFRFSMTRKINDNDAKIADEFFRKRVPDFS